MVHVRTVPTAFHARVIAARLGAEGIVTELRGNVGGPYPFGDVSVWVGEGDADEASELLMADEVEAAFAPHPDDEEPSPSRRAVAFGFSWRQLLAVAGLLIMVWATVAAHTSII
jgi:hypothetical protein